MNASAVLTIITKRARPRWSSVLDGSRQTRLLRCRGHELRPRRHSHGLPDGELYVLEVNANPGISGDEEVVLRGSHARPCRYDVRRPARHDYRTDARSGSPRSARMKVCVLQPDYTGSEVDYRHYDPPRDSQRAASR